MGNLNNLFSLAYDRGGKVVEMVRNRLGPDRFFAFWNKVYHDYAFETFRYADLRRELAAFDPGFDWPKYLDDWLIEHKETDWSIDRVRVASAKEVGRDDRVVTVELKQAGEMVEPTVVLCRCGDDELRVPIWPERGSYDVPGARVDRRQDEDRWVVTVQAPSPPSQVIVDPDHALLDAVPENNRWKPEVAWRFTPLMTPLDEASQFQAYDRVSVVSGLFVDQYARGGYKVGVQRLDRWQATLWAGTEPALREAIFGGQFTVLHFPWPRWSAGIFYEEGLYNFYGDVRHSGGRAFLRYRFLETSSFLIDDQGFAEVYFGTGWEFWAGDDGRPVNTGRSRRSACATASARCSPTGTRSRGSSSRRPPSTAARRSGRASTMSGRPASSGSSGRCRRSRASRRRAAWRSGSMAASAPPTRSRCSASAAAGGSARWT